MIRIVWQSPEECTARLVGGIVLAAIWVGLTVLAAVVA